MIPNGTKTFVSALGTYRTLPAYRVVPAPEIAQERNPGEAGHLTGTSLDAPAHRH
jgi:hypothetical protein